MEPNNRIEKTDSLCMVGQASVLPYKQALSTVETFLDLHSVVVEKRKIL